MREITGGLAASRATGARMDDPHYLALLAEAHLRARRRSTAGLAAVAEALELARRERSLFYEPELHRLDGALHAVAGDAEDAEACLRRGLARAREQGSRDARAARRDRPRAAGRPTRAGAAEARAAVAAVHATFEEGFATRDLREAAALLDDRPLSRSRRRAASASTSAPSTTR